MNFESGPDCESPPCVVDLTASLTFSISVMMLKWLMIQDEQIVVKVKWGEENKQSSRRVGIDLVCFLILIKLMSWR